MVLKSIFIPALALLAFTSSTASAGCDYGVKDTDLQVSKSMSENQIRALISEAKQEVGYPTERAMKYEARDKK